MAGHIALGRGREIATQALAFAAASAQLTNPIGAQTYQVRLVANAACHYKIGNGTLAATTGDPFLPASAIEYVMISPGQSIAAIEAATNGLVTATAGTLFVTELG
jgi:hypothetical protein